MKTKGKIILVTIVVLLAAGFIYRFAHLATGGGEHAEHSEHGKENGENKDQHEGEHGVEHGEQEEAMRVKMLPEVQKQQGVVVVTAKKQRLGGIIGATGKVEVNADRIAHVSPRISGKIVSVHASLGDSVRPGQALVRLESVEMGEALSRYQQSKTRLSLAKNNMERVKALVEKKIAPRKEILQAETDYQTALTEVRTDEDRLLLYGLSREDVGNMEGRKTLLPVRSPIGGVITEKHATVGELADPAKNLFTVADLSTVWVLVDINERDLGKVRKGQAASVKLTAFPDETFRGRITYIADMVDEATRTVKARVEVQNSGRKMKPEMFATIELTLPATAPPVLAIAEEAIQELEGKKVVFVTGDGIEFEPREILTGTASGGFVEVAGGLGEGDKYVLKGSFLLKSELLKGELGGHGH